MLPTRPEFPAGLPTHIATPAAWKGPNMTARDDWIETLSAAERDELAGASQRWLETQPGRTLDLQDSTPLASLNAAQFPLPQLGPRLKRLLAEIQQGRGFVLLRGLPVQQWGASLSAVAFYGLGSHLGAARSQNAQRHLLGHVRDAGLASSDPHVRIYQTRERQTFHTDSCDIVGLLCLRTARSGGLSALVSSVTLYNELRARRPDLAPWLFAPVATDRRGEIPAGAKPYFEIPVFNWHAGQLSAIYQRQYVNSAQRFADAPRLASEHIQALDLLDDLTNDPALHFTMALQPGDMQFVLNHSLLHDRTAFDNWPEPERQRYLLRLWLAPADARPLPPVYAQRYGSVAVGARGGVWVAG